MKNESDTLVDSIPLSGDTFMKGVFELRGLCHDEGHNYLFCDGKYLFDPFSEEQSRNMALLADTEKREARFIAQDGQAYELRSVDLRRTAEGQFYVGFKLGDVDLVDDDTRAFVRMLQPHMARSFEITDAKKGFWTPGQRVRGAPNLSPPLPMTHVCQEQRIENASSALMALYGSGSSQSQKQARELATELDVWHGTFLVQYEPETRTALKGLYERHCQAMTEITGLFSQKPSQLKRTIAPPLYCTVSGSVNERNQYMIQPFKPHMQGLYGAELLVTALPFVWVVRFPKDWWEHEFSYAKENKHTAYLYQTNRKFCDVHIPVRHHAGIDEYLMIGNRSLVRKWPSVLHPTTRLGEVISTYVSYLTGDAWPNSNSWHPEDLLQSGGYVRTNGGARWPWITGPYPARTLGIYNHTPLGAYRLTAEKRVGVPQMSLSQGRNGLDNDRAKSAIRKMTADFLESNDFFKEYQPYDHQLACFYHLISQRSWGDVKRLIGI